MHDTFFILNNTIDKNEFIKPLDTITSGSTNPILMIFVLLES